MFIAATIMSNNQQKRIPLFYALFFIANAVLSFTVSTDSIGCPELQKLLTNNHKGSDCFIPDIEILPYIHILESGIHHGIKTANECQKKCQDFFDCAYFTFRTNKEDKTTTCHLKPHPGYNSSPKMIIRSYSSDSKFNYISGPAQCSQLCVEEQHELSDGCGGASPASCALISSNPLKPDGITPAVNFNSTCGVSQPKKTGGALTPPKECGVKGYQCCVDCLQYPQNCCQNTRLEGVYLEDGETIIASTHITGIVSPDHCHSLCLATQGCTHWNYIISPATSFLRGACYLKAYKPINKPILKEVSELSLSLTNTPTFHSIVGAVNCDKDYGVYLITPKEPDSTSTDDTKSIGKSFDGTCFKKGVDMNENTDTLSILYSDGYAEQLDKSPNHTEEAKQKLRIQALENCQKLCQATPGCRYIQTKWNHCYLKFSNSGATYTGDNQMFFGPRSCQSSKFDDGCALINTKYTGKVFEHFKVPAAIFCSTRCKNDNRCVGWTQQSLGECLLFEKIDSKETSIVHTISGLKDCIINDPNQHRLLENSDQQDENISITTQQQQQHHHHGKNIPERCILKNQSFKGYRLESLQTKTLVECYLHCVKSPYCNMISTIDDGREVCDLYKNGTLVHAENVISIKRGCPEEELLCNEDQCSILSSEIQ